MLYQAQMQSEQKILIQFRLIKIKTKLHNESLTGSRSPACLPKASRTFSKIGLQN